MKLKKGTTWMYVVGTTVVQYFQGTFKMRRFSIQSLQSVHDKQNHQGTPMHYSLVRG